jgi:signal transduction histidine kinase
MKVELTQKHWQKDYPNHPDWKLHGSFSEDEVRDIMGELIEGWIGYSLPLIALTLGIGYYLARKSLRPIQRVNEQLQRISPKTLGEKIVLHEGDKEFRDLLEHINDLLGRLHNSFTEMSEYAAKVAHELRTPLAIIRLKVEQADAMIDPELSEELQEEVHRLTHVVDQSLLIAKAEQGRLVWQRERFDLSEMVVDVAKDFELLATESGRAVRVRTQAGCFVHSDAKYFKQVLHNLLTNALKHGQGDIVVRLMRKENRGGLIIFNKVPKSPGRADKTLALGLRVVNALLSHQPDIQFRSGARNGHYAARVKFGCATN